MGSKTALVVDDSKSARFALRKYLESHAFHVDTAESAEEAYSFLKTHQPDLIFLDHVMPGTDGFEALRHIKADPQSGEIPVVICSSNEGAEFTNEARERGAADVLQKPPSPDQLGRILAGLQRLSTQLRPPAPRTPEPPPPSKVSNIRDADVAIEQAVMKQIRSSLPERPPPAPFSTPSFSPAAPSAPPPAFAPSATFLAPPTPHTPHAPYTPPPQAPVKADAGGAGVQHLREQIEARMKKITQDLFVQIAELKAGLATVESQQQAPEYDRAAIHAVVQDGLGGLHQRVEAIERGVEAQIGEMRQQLGEMRNQVEAALQLQNEHTAQVVQQARAAAHEEAHAAAERTVMAAASRIADQLADSILKALGRR